MSTIRDLIGLAPGVDTAEHFIRLPDIHAIGIDDYETRSAMLDDVRFAIERTAGTALRHTTTVHTGHGAVDIHHNDKATAPTVDRFDRDDGSEFYVVNVGGQQVYLSEDHALLLAASILRATGTPDMSIEEPAL